jgi:hypothetical protein
MAREVRRQGSQDHPGDRESQHGRLPLHEAIRDEGLAEHAMAVPSDMSRVRTTEGLLTFLQQMKPDGKLNDAMN